MPGGSAKVIYNSQTSMKWMPPEAFAEELRPADFEAGDSVSVYCRSRDLWTTGEVLQVLAEPCISEWGAHLPAGAVEVSYLSGEQVKWVPPESFTLELRAVRPFCAEAAATEAADKSRATLARAAEAAATAAACSAAATANADAYAEASAGAAVESIQEALQEAAARIAGGFMPEVSPEGLASYQDGAAVDLREVGLAAAAFVAANAGSERLAGALEHGDLALLSMQLYADYDKDSVGHLSWGEGQIQSFVECVFCRLGASPPHLEEVARLVPSFDHSGVGLLSPVGCLSLVDALARAVALSPGWGAAPEARQVQAPAQVVSPAMNQHDEVEAWLEDHRPDERVRELVHEGAGGAPMTFTATLGGALVMDLAELAPAFAPSATANARRLRELAVAVLEKSLLRGALQGFRRGVAGDADASFLPWPAISELALAAFVERGFAPPTPQQILPIYRRFDAAVHGGLTLCEALCLVEVLATLVLLAGAAAVAGAGEGQDRAAIGSSTAQPAADSAPPPPPQQVTGSGSRSRSRSSERPPRPPCRAEQREQDGASSAAPAVAVAAAEPAKESRPRELAEAGDSILKTPSMTYLGEVQVCFAQLAPALRQTAEANLGRRAAIVAAVEQGALARLAVEAFQVVDPSGGTGLLRWSAGEIYEFVVGTARSVGLAAPSQDEVCEVFRLFADGGDELLDVREAVCLADALLRAMYHGIAAVERGQAAAA